MTEYQITLKFTQEGNHCRNVLHYHQTAGTTVSWPDILQEFAVAWSGGLAASYSPGTLFHGIDVLRLDPGFVTQSFDVVGSPLPGTGQDEPGPAQVASLVTLYGELPLKPNRGRIYLPSPNREQYSATGGFLLVHSQRVEEFVDNILELDDTEGALLRLVIYSRVYPNGAAIQFNNVVQGVARGNPATQRKRRLGVGS